MQRPARLTRSKVGPGLIDRPTPRRSSAVVAQEKAEKQKAADSRAEESQHRAAQVSEVEREVRKAQAEAHAVGDGGKITKKKFSRPSQDAIVSPTSNQVRPRLFHSFPLILTFVFYTIGYRGWSKQEDRRFGRPIR